MSSSEQQPGEPTPFEIAMVAATLAARGGFTKDRAYTGAPTYGERYIESAHYLLKLAAGSGFRRVR